MPEPETLFRRRDESEARLSARQVPGREESPQIDHLAVFQLE